MVKRSIAGVIQLCLSVYAFGEVDSYIRNQLEAEYSRVKLIPIDDREFRDCSGDVVDQSITFKKEIDRLLYRDTCIEGNYRYMRRAWYSVEVYSKGYILKSPVRRMEFLSPDFLEIGDVRDRGNLVAIGDLPPRTRVRKNMPKGAVLTTKSLAPEDIRIAGQEVWVVASYGTASVKMRGTMATEGETGSKVIVRIGKEIISGWIGIDGVVYAE